MELTQCRYAFWLTCILSFTASAASLTESEKKIGLDIVNQLDNIFKTKITTGHSGGFFGVGRPIQITPDYIDCILLLDNSASIGPAEFTQSKEAAKVLVDYIESKSSIEPNGSRISLIEFSTIAQTKVVFGLLSSKAYALEVKNAIDSLGYDAGSHTATERALQVAKAEFRRHKIITHARTAWILTDGQSNVGGDPAAAALELKDMGVRVCALAVGSGVNMNEIRNIASTNCAFNLASFAKLASAIGYAAASRAHHISSPSVAPDFFSGIDFGKRLLQHMKDYGI